MVGSVFRASYAEYLFISKILSHGYREDNKPSIADGEADGLTCQGYGFFYFLLLNNNVMNLNITVKIDPKDFPKKWEDSDKVQEAFLIAIHNALDTSLQELMQETRKNIPNTVEGVDKGRDQNGWDFEFRLK